MKKLILIFIMFIVLSCSHKTLDIDDSIQYTIYMHNSLNTTYSKHQVDSMIISDSLPQLNDWQQLYGRDDESKDKISIYFYLKQDSIVETVYRLEYIDSITYKIIKRQSYNKE